MIRRDEYPQVERRAGDHVTQRQPSYPQRALAAFREGSINGIAANLTHMSGPFRSRTLFADANYFSAA
jgi:hypothetical protein